MRKASNLFGSSFSKARFGLILLILPCTARLHPLFLILLLIRDLIFIVNFKLEFIGGGWSMNDEGATHYSGWN